jgi:cell division initiation protein
MKLTPLEVQQKTFRKVRLGGLDAAEVGQFLEQVAVQMEDLVRETHRLHEALRQKDSQLAEHREREGLLQSTLTTAQRVTDDLKAQARRESELLLSDAELQAEKIIANAQAKRLALISEIDELKRAKSTFVSQLGALVEGHRALLESLTGEAPGQKPAAPGDNVSFLAPNPAKRQS